MFRRFMRGMMWGAALGAVVAGYWFSTAGRGERAGESSRTEAAERYRLRRLRRAALQEAASQALENKPSRLQLALDAGRAAMDATLALLGRRV